MKVSYYRPIVVAEEEQIVKAGRIFPSSKLYDYGAGEDEAILESNNTAIILMLSIM